MVINVMISMNRVSHLKWTWIRSSLLLFRGFLLMDVMFPRRKVEKIPKSSFFVIQVPWNHYPKTGAIAASLLICFAAAAFAATWCTSSLSSSVSVSLCWVFFLLFRTSCGNRSPGFTAMQKEADWPRSDPKFSASDSEPGSKTQQLIGPRDISIWDKWYFDFGGCVVAWSCLPSHSSGCLWSSLGFQFAL